MKKLLAIVALLGVSITSINASPLCFKLKNSKCFTKNYPPGSVIPGCSSSRESECYGSCYKRTDNTTMINVSYCEGNLFTECKLELYTLTTTGMFTHCESAYGKCNCANDYQTVTSTIEIYRCTP